MRRRMRNGWAWLVASLCATALFAQAAGRIEGRLTGEDGKPLAGVTVTLVESGRTARTDAGGSFAIADVPPGTYTVLFNYELLADTEPPVTVAAGETSRVDRTLDWNLSFQESIIVVSASRAEERITEAPAAITALPIEEIEVKAATGQLPKLFEFTPGAEVTQSGIYDYNLNTRGFNSSLNRRVATLVDGRDPSVPFLGSQEWAAISFPLDDLAQAELVRGPSAALYGANASSGVLNLVTKRPRDSQGGLIRLTGGELSTFNGDFRWAGSITDSTYYKVLGGIRNSGDFTVSRNGKAEYAIPCSRSGQTDCLPQELVPLDPEDDDSIWFGGLRLDQYFGEEMLLTVEGGYAEVEGPVFQTGIGRVQLVDVERPWARANFSLDHWNFGGSWNRRDATKQTALSSGSNVALDDENLNFDAQSWWDLGGERGRLVVGGTYTDEDIDSTDPATGRQTLMFEPVSNQSSAFYAQIDWNFNDRWKVIVAGRYDESDLHDAQFSPKAGVVWQLTPNHAFRLTYNEAFQVANYSEFFLQANVAAPLNLQPFEGFCRPYGVSCGFSPGPTRIVAVGNNDLEVEEIKTWEFGYTAILGNRSLLTAEYYRSESDNFITDLIPQLGTGLGRVNPDFGPYAPPSSLPGPAQAALLAALRGALGASFAILTNNFDGTPMLAAVSYTNFGKVDTQGIDLGLDWSLTNAWTINATASWFDFEIQDSSPGLDQLLLPNTPEYKLSAGVSYRADRWSLGVSGRWVDEFRWVVGPFQGQVEAYTTIDINGSWDVTDHIELALNVANALDEEHWESFGGDLLGRRALGSLTFRW
ncbi:MAG: TonB-dependent receptor [Thermoanaerobaculia bacterium]